MKEQINNQENESENVALVEVCRGPTCRYRPELNPLLELDGQVIDGVNVEARAVPCLWRCGGRGTVRLTVNGNSTHYGLCEYIRPTLGRDVYSIGENPQETIRNAIQNRLESEVKGGSENNGTI